MNLTVDDLAKRAYDLAVAPGEWKRADRSSRNCYRTIARAVLLSLKGLHSAHVEALVNEADRTEYGDDEAA
jgi:hypothetical protein